MTTKQVVTAQDIKLAIIPAYSPYMDGPGVDMDATVKNIEALLSQARQEARREGRMEGLREMDDAHALTHTAFADGHPLLKLRQEYQK
jgi:hypothetical protein